MTSRLFAAAAIVAAAAACHRDPNVSYARMLERAASWSAAVQFAGEMEQAGNVPQSYVHDVLTTAAQDLEQLRDQIGSDSDVPEPSRAAAASWCGELVARLQAADRQRAVPHDGSLRDLEMRLRDEATRARGGAALETRR